MAWDGPKWGWEDVFPINPDLADILGRTDLDFENLYVFRCVGPHISRFPGRCSSINFQANLGIDIELLPSGFWNRSKHACGPGRGPGPYWWAGRGSICLFWCLGGHLQAETKLFHNSDLFHRTCFRERYQHLVFLFYRFEEPDWSMFIKVVLGYRLCKQQC